MVNGDEEFTIQEGILRTVPFFDYWLMWATSAELDFTGLATMQTLKHFACWFWVGNEYLDLFGYFAGGAFQQQLLLDFAEAIHYEELAQILGEILMDRGYDVEIPLLYGEW